MEGVKPDIPTLLGSLNGPAMAHWLVDCANRRGVRCGRTAEEKWRRNWRVWSEFCALRGVDAFPIERTHVETFLVDCAMRGRRRDTVAGYLTTLKAVIGSVDASDPMETEEGKASLQRLMATYFPERLTESLPAAPPMPASPAPIAAAPTDVKPATPANSLRRSRPAIRQEDRPPEHVAPARETVEQAPELLEPFVVPNAPAPLEQELPMDAQSTATRAVERLPAPLMSSKPPSPQSPAAAARIRNPPPKLGARSKPPPPFELPEDYGRRWWTHRMRLKEQARAVWAARYAMRQLTPERFKLLRLAVRELELADEGYSEIGAAVLRGFIGGGGGFRSVADRIGMPAESLRAAFARDEVPPPGVVRKLVAHWLKSGGSQARHEAPGRHGLGADLPI